MGLPDLYPFVISPVAEGKLAFVHELIAVKGGRTGAVEPRSAQRAIVTTRVKQRDKPSQKVMPPCRLPGTMPWRRRLACIPTSKKGALTMRRLLILSAATAALISAGAAYADTMATATRDLNVRAGPGTQNPVIGVIGSGQSVNINGCVQNGRWCTVAFDGGEGWVSAKYLSGDLTPDRSS